MNGRILLRIFSAVILIALLVGAGAMIFNAGLMQGAAASGKLPAPGAANAPYPGYGYGPWMMGHWGFGFFPFGFIFPLIGFLFFFAIIRALFWGMWGGPRHFYGPMGWGRRGMDPDQVPPAVEEWHKRMHQAPPGPEDKPNG